MLAGFQQANNVSFADHVADVARKCVLPHAGEGVKVAKIETPVLSGYMLYDDINGDGAPTAEERYYRGFVQVSGNMAATAEEGVNDRPEIPFARALTYRMRQKLSAASLKYGFYTDLIEGCPEP